MTAVEACITGGVQGTALKAFRLHHVMAAMYNKCNSFT